jgi:hypothetical protein
LRGRNGCFRAKASRCCISGRLTDQCCRPQRLGVALRIHQYFHGASDHGQHVVEIVRRAASKLPDRIEFLCLLQLALGFLSVGVS